MGDWQNAATIVILLAAAGYVVYGAVRRLRRRGSTGCHCCSKRHRN
jgi:hypothetical protein